ncbi:MAG: hypothetical protein HOH84_03775 [Flavobacteriaceae bacterium]|jgi:hypothetical protein|nr:hypothetical protein [Flavobacteriaceae bacterium]MBT6689451.1 hypothetical protein [Flavobacteriaceae bacterium]MBT7320989.1 hypothetical protein [Flavobacteriaceae bacterium]MBT7554049.1 hypothetical protein [Flavobacteriaceae bacterium]|tara:strand:- start:602 stop:1084 length:483 start_codon:yes stop_codon:yes gene_type:complete
MIYRIRIILDTKEDIIRDLEIEDKSSFEDLHFAIIKSFQLMGKEMASFYISNNEWVQGEEITLQGFGNDKNEKIMKEYSLESLINEDQMKFIYIYDFLNLWTFFIEIFEVNEIMKNTKYPKTIFSLGELPEEAPTKQFEEIKDINNLEDDHQSDYDDFYN